MSWEIIHGCLLHPFESDMKEMIHHRTITGLTKHLPKKINQAPCIKCYTENSTTSPKGTNVDTTNLQLEEIIHVLLAVYNVTSIQGLNSMQNVICTNNIML